MNNTAGLEDILVKHYKRYPCMQIQDMVKLIYQNEFAGGHLINDENDSLSRLREEYSIVTGKCKLIGYESDSRENGRGCGSYEYKLAGTSERIHKSEGRCASFDGDRCGTADRDRCGTAGRDRCGTAGRDRSETADRDRCGTTGRDRCGTADRDRCGPAGRDEPSPAGEGLHISAGIDEHITGTNCDEASGSERVFEDIGNGLYRIHLAELDSHTIRLETVNKFFICTAKSKRGTVQSFEDKLEVLRSCCNKGTLPFAIDELDEYILAYKQQGYPPVSHSGSYRNINNPAYRIVLADFCRYFKIFCQIDHLLTRVESEQYTKDHITVAVDGNSCSGKSSLAALLSEIYDCNVFHMDHFFLTPELRTNERLGEIGGNVDYVRFKNEVINGLESRCEFTYRIYDCSTKTIDRAVKVKPKNLNIIEGSYSMHPTLSENYDLKIFLSVEADEQSRRIFRRNGPVMHKRFLEEWVPKENKYFEEFHIRSKSDIVL